MRYDLFPLIYDDIEFRGGEGAGQGEMDVVDVEVTAAGDVTQRSISTTWTHYLRPLETAARGRGGRRRRRRRLRNNEIAGDLFV